MITSCWKSAVGGHFLCLFRNWVGPKVSKGGTRSQTCTEGQSCYQNTEQRSSDYNTHTYIVSSLLKTPILHVIFTRKIVVCCFIMHFGHTINTSTFKRLCQNIQRIRQIHKFKAQRQQNEEQNKKQHRKTRTASYNTTAVLWGLVCDVQCSVQFAKHIRWNMQFADCMSKQLNYLTIQFNEMLPNMLVIRHSQLFSFLASVCFLFCIF